MLGIVAVGVVRESRKFRAPIGRIARSSLRQHSFLVFCMTNTATVLRTVIYHLFLSLFILDVIVKKLFASLRRD